jgi:alkyl hydroperoxide reductase subunit AhpC
MVQVGDKAPDFILKGIFKGVVGDYATQNYRGKWLVLFFYPADFTFICPTEVTGFSDLAEEFRADNAEILGVSVDSVETHRKWVQELGGVKFPLLSDEDKKISRLYGVLDEREGLALRATFIMSPAADVSYIVVSHANVGRSVEETLRVVRALRTERLCPSGWVPGATTGDLKLRY